MQQQRCHISPIFTAMQLHCRTVMYTALVYNIAAHEMQFVYSQRNVFKTTPILYEERSDRRLTILDIIAKYNIGTISSYID